MLISLREASRVTSSTNESHSDEIHGASSLRVVNALRPCRKRNSTAACAPDPLIHFITAPVDRYAHLARLTRRHFTYLTSRGYFETKSIRGYRFMTVKALAAANLRPTRADRKFVHVCEIRKCSKMTFEWIENAGEFRREFVPTLIRVGTPSHADESEQKMRSILLFNFNYREIKIHRVPNL